MISTCCCWPSASPPARASGCEIDAEQPRELGEALPRALEVEPAGAALRARASGSRARSASGPGSGAGRRCRSRARSRRGASRSPPACPRSWSRPASGRYMPERMLISVDLPAPFSPSSACTSPAQSVRSMPSLATTPGKTLVIPRSSQSGGGCVPGSIVAFGGHFRSCGRAAARCGPRPGRLYVA